MKRFIEGEPRSQSVLFPEHLDDWIVEDNPVRAVDAFVDELDLQALGFEGADEEILKCEQAQVTPLVPKPLNSGAKAAGRFDKRDFIYNKKRNEYPCPAGERAVWRFSTMENGMTLHKYCSSACPRCPMRSSCTPSDYRRITRWEHKEVLDRMQTRLDLMPAAGRLRRQTVEHTFGTLKAWMGAAHFLTKTLPRVRTETSLHVLAYNLKRVIGILGVQALITAITS